MTPTLCDTTRPSPDESDDALLLRPRKARTLSHRTSLTESTDDLEPARALALARLLRPTEHWRLFADLRAHVRFLDIETLGLAPEDAITVVGISDGVDSATLVRGMDLTRDRLARWLHGAGLIVTFNGIAFDVPRLKRSFPGLPWDLPHFDLAVEGRRLGLNGGLKRVERKLGYTRPRELRGVGGAEAIKLWKAHCQGDPRALRRLTRYCRADVAALVHLAQRIYERLLKQQPAEASDGWLERRRD